MTTVEEHIQTARDFLGKSDQEFESGDILQGSEKLWGAASHAVMAVAQQKGWDFGKNTAPRKVVELLTSEYEEPLLKASFAVAQQFHANFYHDFMEDEDIEQNRPIVRDFVHRIVAIAEGAGE